MPTPELREELARLCAEADQAALALDGGRLAASVAAATPLAAETLTVRLTAVVAAAQTDVHTAVVLWTHLRSEMRTRRPAL
jgi:hypothetical protein